MELSGARLRDDLKTAMRAKDELKTRVLRNVLAAVKNKAIEAKSESLGEKELIAVVKREAKQCNETLEFARKAGRDEAIAEHEATIAVLEEYLPNAMSEDELKAAIAGLIDETGATQIGPVMKELGARFAGRYDGKLASRLVGEALAGS